ncbi:hypothetical protein [Aeromonas veronii]|uniref:hypothetical protein n=1 Tax=Aeromonas veronii TaxID=654 RepID=UPI002B46E1BF|nr:hypothetical protein [Aeromonas veronii]
MQSDTNAVCDTNAVFDDIEFTAKMITCSNPADAGRVESIILSLVSVGRQSLSNPPTRLQANQQLDSLHT